MTRENKAIILCEFRRRRHYRHQVDPRLNSSGRERRWVRERPEESEKVGRASGVNDFVWNFFFEILKGCRFYDSVFVFCNRFFGNKQSSYKDRPESVLCLKLLLKMFFFHFWVLMRKRKWARFPKVFRNARNARNLQTYSGWTKLTYKRKRDQFRPFLSELRNF